MQMQVLLSKKKGGDQNHQNTDRGSKANSFTHTNTYAHTYTYMYTHLHLHLHTLMHTYTHLHMLAHTYPHFQTNTSHRISKLCNCEPAADGGP